MQSKTFFNRQLSLVCITLFCLTGIAGQNAQATTDKYRHSWTDDPATTMNIGFRPVSGSDSHVQAGSYDRLKLVHGARVYVSVTTTNQGNEPAVNTWTRLVVSTEIQIDATDLKISFVQVGSLGAGASRAQTKRLVLLSDILPGTYYLGAIADSSGCETEAVESNNRLSGPMLDIHLHRKI